MRPIAGTAEYGITFIHRGGGVTLSPRPTASLAVSSWLQATIVGQVQFGTACREVRFLASSEAFFQIRRAPSSQLPCARRHSHTMQSLCNRHWVSLPQRDKRRGRTASRCRIRNGRLPIGTDLVPEFPRSQIPMVLFRTRIFVISFYSRPSSMN